MPDQQLAKCAMYDHCGKRGFFGQQLPCPDGKPARKVDSKLRAKLQDTCGDEFGNLGLACCTEDQASDLSQSLARAEPLISTCPACRNNFVQFYCHFTCSPNQAQFVQVTSTQTVTNTKLGQPNQAVKAVNFWVSPKFQNDFFDSCKEIKFGATSGYVMDLIGGGAKTASEFLKYMGDERPGLGSPFQIDFPVNSSSLVGAMPIHSAASPPQSSTSQPFVRPRGQQYLPLDIPALHCNSSSLNSRCACADCPSVCPSLPPAPPLFIPPPSSHHCRVGRMSCGDFSILFIYSLGLSGFLVYLAWREILKLKDSALVTRRNGDNDSGYETPSGYERVSMHDPLAPNGSDMSDVPDNDDEAESPQVARSRNNPLIGASSMAGNEVPATSRSITPLSPNGHAFFPRHRIRRAPSTLTSDPDARLSGIHHQPRSYPLNLALSRAFYHLGYGCASKPYLTIALVLLCCGLLNLGWSKFQVEQDPVKLWVAKGSRSALEKTDFENKFGPFYRTEQIFITSQKANEPVLSYDRLKWIAEFEQAVRSLRAPSGASLPSVCLAPTSNVQSPTSSSDCVVQSLLGYLGNSLDGVNERNWIEKLDRCAHSPVSCLSSYGQPLAPKMIFGGMPGSGDPANAKFNVSEARAVIITFVLNNYMEKELLDKAKEWEEGLRAHLDDLTSGSAPFSQRPESVGLKLSWSTEISLQGEINKSTNTDMPIVALSYLAMFLYVAINLGGSGMVILSALWRCLGSLIKSAIPRVFRLGRADERNSLFPSARTRSTSLKRHLLVESKFSLALWSILIVLLSVSTSIGLFSLIGVKITLIIAEVIPFLVLAIGVDNVFIFANEVSRQNSRAYMILTRGPGYDEGEGIGLLDEEDSDNDEMEGLPSVEMRIAKAISRMGPSILISASCETAAFGLGAIVGMPAVRNFAIYAAGAVLINTILQMTIFVSAMAIDLRRMESNRVDCMPCVKLGTTSSVSDRIAAYEEGNFARFIRTVYAPFLMKRRVKLLVICVFSSMLVFSILTTRKIELGLDQRLALPPESHLVDYFDALDKYFDVGPPVYFVSQGVNVTDRAGQQAICGRFSTCEEFSLANVLEAERKRPNSSLIVQPPSVWLDDFFQWLNPSLDSCCRVKKSNPEEFCSEKDRERSCRPCFKGKQPPWNITMQGFPEGDTFMKYLNRWLISPTTPSCPLGGKASYHNAVNLTSSSQSVAASHFRSYHQPMKAQSDYINALSSARRIAEDLSRRTGGVVYPYSVFYVFFDQYSYIILTSVNVILLALLSVFFISSTLLGSWRTGAVISLTVLMMVFNITGAMGVWDINLNAISLVNLVIGVGVGVEFCSHIARAFIGANGGGLPIRHPQSQKDHDERVSLALSDVGSSVFAGIFTTKLVGIVVLGLTRSKLLQIYYFRMWLALIVSGGLSGLVLLPVLLSMWGGQGYGLDDDELDLIDLINSRYLSDQQQRQHFDSDDDDH